jgi:hypothetical protein
MPTSAARIETPQAARYLAMLSRHADAVTGRASQHLHRHATTPDAHPRLRHVERSDTDATLHFDQGRCTIHVEPDALALRAEADDAENLRRIEDLIAADLHRFGAREHLTITWRTAVNDDRSVESMTHCPSCSRPQLPPS